jgi:hypothetical protein
MMGNELEFPNGREGVRGNRGFPLPGTQENYNSFASRNIIMEKR